MRVSVPEGCLCFPGDREQDLCAQHLNRLTFPFTILRYYVPEGWNEEKFRAYVDGAAA